jgi:cytokinin dehydrogenase
MAWMSDLAGEIGGQVLTDDSSREAVSTDFGRIVARQPAVVVRPGSTEDVARVVKFAAKHSLGVGTRGAGHSQTGQSLSEHIVLDMTSLEQVKRLGPPTGAEGAGVSPDSSGTVVCQAGLKWRSLVEQLGAVGLSPPVLTNNLDVTIGGTLSTGGLGVASWQRGTQADNCLELEVVTGTGEIVRCSPDQNRELFDSVRAGVGQFGIITEATLEVRRHKPGFCSYYLLYDDLNVLLEDLKLLMTGRRFDYLESWCAPCAQGFKKVSGGERQAFAQWFYPLHATIETDWSQADRARADAAKLQGLRFYKHVHTEIGELGDFFTRLDSLFALWKRGGFWDHAHPWMECVLPWPSAVFYITQVLQNTPPQAIAGGHILLWPARGQASRVPLFVRPAGEFLMGFGILSAVPQPLLDEALLRLSQASQASIMMGGKRYLSGWVAFDAAQWRAHYGDLWPEVARLKKQFDPQGVLNPGFVKYE